jgi:hypothetical protein
MRRFEQFGTGIIILNLARKKKDIISMTGFRLHHDVSMITRFL